MVDAGVPIYGVLVNTVFACIIVDAVITVTPFKKVDADATVVPVKIVDP